MRRTGEDHRSGSGVARARAPAGGGAGQGLLRGLALAAVFAAAGILPFTRAHVDDVDGAVYQVVARHLASDGHLLHLHFLPEFWPRFFEHPPLFVWIQAALIRLGSEALLPWLGAAVGITTVVVTYAAGRQLVGSRAASFGALVLASTEQFFRYQARPRLDPPLALAYTGAVALLLAARGRTPWLVAGGLVAGLGALVKGPPALGAPVSALLALVVLGRAGEVRRPGAWLAIGAAVVGPPLLFLAVDGVTGAGWWDGYVRHQLLASLTGARAEGRTYHGYLLLAVAGGFWPGLPLLAIALIAAVRAPRAPRSRAVLGLVAWAAVVLAGFSAAGRAYWWYAVPAFMPLALAAGAGLELALERAFGEAGPRRGIQVAAVVGALGLALVPAWPVRWLVARCPFGDLPARAAAMAGPGQVLRLGAAPSRGPSGVRALAGWLAQHTGHDVVVAGGAGPRAGVFEEPSPGPPAGWSVVARDGSWVLAAAQEASGRARE